MFKNKKKNNPHIWSLCCSEALIYQCGSGLFWLLDASSPYCRHVKRLLSEMITSCFMGKLRSELRKNRTYYCAALTCANDYAPSLNNSSIYADIQFPG